MRKIFFALVLIIILTGCSGGGNAPVTPSNDKPANPVGSLDSVPIIAGTMNEDGSFNALGLMGAYEMTIDPAKAGAELVSKRLPTLGQSWIVSGIGFFTIAPCSDCLQISSIALTTENYLQLTFKIKHPFQKGDPLKPPSAVNRLDLDVFDVALVIQPVGTTPVNYALTGAKIYSGILANNAGYTKELADVTDDNAALPYALVIDNSLGGTSTWNKFAMGADSFFDVFFNLNTMTAFGFDMYLTMGYGASATKPTRLTPTYFNPEFNRKPAWKVVVTPPQGTDPPEMGNTWDDNNGTDIYNVTVKVYDWQQGVTTINNPPVAPGDIAFASNVSRVTVEIPGMTSTLPQATTPTSGTGTPTNPLIYKVPIANQNLLDDGEYIGLVKVSDSRLPEATPPGAYGIDFLIEGMTLINYAIPEFAAYQTFVATVVIGNTPPNADLSPAKASICSGKVVFFDAGGSTDAEDDAAAIPLNFEWDWDYNGVPFVSDTGPPGPDPTVTSPPYSGPGPYTTAVRVTDSGGMTDIATATVTINDTLAVDSWTNNVTDGSTITSVLYYHTKPALGYQWDGRVKSMGTEGMAYGNGYVYLTFYVGTGAGGSVYFTRSSDGGQTWDTPTAIATGITNCRAASIDAVGSTVMVAYSTEGAITVHVLVNTNSGSGTWTNNLAHSFADSYIWCTGIAIDPSNTNYANLCYWRGSNNVVMTGFYVSRNSTGGSGAWTELYVSYTPDTTQGHELDIDINTDGAVYAAYIANSYCSITRSDNHGATFASFGSNTYTVSGMWGTEIDLCFDPTNVNVVYAVIQTLGNGSGTSANSLRLLKSTDRANTVSCIQGNLIPDGTTLCHHPAIMVDSYGKLFIAYSFATVYNADYDIYVRTSCNGGTTLSTATKINTADDAGLDADPELVMIPSSGIVITWDDNGYLNYNTDNPSGKIVARHLW